MIKSILVAADGSGHARAARELALSLASAFEARVTGVHVVDVRLLEQPPFVVGAYPVETIAPSQLPIEMLEGFRAHADKIMSDFRDAASAGTEVEFRIEEGVPAETIADVAESYDLLILGKRGAHAQYSDDLVGSTADQVVRKSGTPVLLVDGETPPLRRVMVFYDGSGPANNALKLAAEMASTLGGGLRILTVAGDLDEAAKTQQDAREYLSAYEIEAEFRVAEGEFVFEALEDLETEPSDLAVLGKHGHSFLHDLILGGTTEQLMRQARIALLLVP